jgi:hypothetical protein
LHTLLVTVVVPIMNGAPRTRELWEHAAVVTSISGVMTAVWIALGRQLGPGSPRQPLGHSSRRWRRTRIRARR